MSLSKFKNQLEKEFSDSMKSLILKYDYLEMFVESSNLHSIIMRLKNEYGFDMLSDLTCVDYVEERAVFELIYNLYSIGSKNRVLVKCEIDAARCEIESVTDIYKAANWYEREVYDMFGVKFSSHPNLKRILLYEEFEGYPLRESYVREKRQPKLGPVEYIKPCGSDGGESLERLKEKLVIKRD